MSSQMAHQIGSKDDLLPAVDEISFGGSQWAPLSARTRTNKRTRKRLKMFGQTQEPSFIKPIQIPAQFQATISKKLANAQVASILVGLLLCLVPLETLAQQHRQHRQQHVELQNITINQTTSCVESRQGSDLEIIPKSTQRFIDGHKVSFSSPANFTSLSPLELESSVAPNESINHQQQQLTQQFHVNTAELLVEARAKRVFKGVQSQGVAKHRAKRKRRWISAPISSRPARPVINAMLRGQVNLKCNLQAPSADDEVSLILWYKDNSMVPIYSVDARATPVQEARHKPGAWLEGRSSLRIVDETTRPAGLEPSEQQQQQQLSGLQKRRRRRRRQTVGEEEDEEEKSRLDEDLARFQASFWLNPASANELPNESMSRRQVRTERSQLVSGTRPQLFAQLQIDSLSSEDNGLYKCRVDFRRARSRIEQFELRIIVPAEKPVIRDLTRGPSSNANPLQANNLIGPHGEGSRVILECETSNGYPEPSLSWWRDGKLIDDSYEIVSASNGLVLERHGNANSGANADNEPLEAIAELDLVSRLPIGATSTEISAANPTGEPDEPADSETKRVAGATTNSNRLIRNRLELLGLTRDDLLANYSCSAWNSKLGAPPTSYVMIDMNLRPIRVQIDNERAPVLARKPLEVVCRAFGSRPAARMSWFLGKRKLEPTKTGPLKPNHQGPEVAGEKRKQQQQQQWKRAEDERVSITESISADSNVTSSILTFVPQLEHLGQLLTCRAQNSLANDDSSLSPVVSNYDNAAVEPQQTLEDSWKLEIHHLPRVKLSLGDKLVGKPIQVGHDVYFECSAQAQPAAHELRWWFNGKELETNVSSGVIISNQSLVLQRVSHQQRGQYTCSAINSVGESQSNVVQLRIQHAPICREQTVLSSSSSSSKSSPEDSFELDNNSLHPKHSTMSSSALQAHHKTLYGAARLETIRVRCHVDADPVDAISYKWAFVARTSNGGDNQSSDSQKSRSSATTQADSSDNSQRPEWSGQQVLYLDQSLIERKSPNDLSYDPLESVLNYTPKSELDYGTLLCWASNALGSQAEPCVYQVVPAERPEPVRNCRLLNATYSQLAVACEPGYDGGIDQSFHMEVYESEGRELVANVTNIPGLTSDLFSSPPNSKTYNSTSDELDHSMNDQASEQERVGLVEPSSGSGSGQRQLAASLVSEPSLGAVEQQNQSRNQKQRHSQHQKKSRNFGGSKSSGRPTSIERPEHEAIFLTEAQLSPATEYLLSIYSTNSKGSSKAISLNAATSNQSSLGSNAQSLGAAAFWPISMFARNGPNSRQLGIGANGRTSGPSHVDQASALMNEVFSLSWSPFLLVCAVTILIFLMFASVTFALIKYVDLSGILVGHNQANQDGPDSSQTKRQKKDEKWQTEPTAVSVGGPNYGLNLSNYTKNDGAESRVESQDQEHTSNEQSLCNEVDGLGNSTLQRKRARVIAVGNWPDQSSRLSAGDKELEIPLNGMSNRSDRSSLLNGSFLRSKLQQITSGQSSIQTTSCIGPSGLKQSNSDNFLNQTSAGLDSSKMLQSSVLAPNHSLTTTKRLGARDENWALHYRTPQSHHNQSAYYAAGGTLPRHYPPMAAMICASSNGQALVEAPLQVASSNHDNGAAPYGYMKVIKSANQACLMPAANFNSTAYNCGYGLAPACQQQSGAANSKTEAQVEHLLISGKRFIHQMRPTPPSPPPQQQQQDQQRHLRVTSLLAAGQQNGQFNYLNEPTYVSGQQSVRQLGNAQQAVSRFLDGLSYCTNAATGEQTANNKTSDLGDEDEEDQLNQLHDSRGRQEFQLPMGTNFVDSDGLSSQDTQRSSNATGCTNNTTNTLLQSATNGSPSSGLGNELRANSINHFDAACNHCLVETSSSSELGQPFGRIHCHQNNLADASPVQLDQHQHQIQHQNQTIGRRLDEVADQTFGLAAQMSCNLDCDYDLEPMNIEQIDQHQHHHQQHQHQQTTAAASSKLLQFGAIRTGAKSAGVKSTKESFAANFEAPTKSKQRSIDPNNNNNNNRLLEQSTGDTFYLIDQSATGCEDLTLGGSQNNKARVRLVNGSSGGLDKLIRPSQSETLVLIDSNGLPLFVNECANCESTVSHQEAQRSTVDEPLQTDV